jgi:glycosyltransferase involved in cell wall biosynthesis
LHVLMIGDGLALTSGFAQVNRQVAQALVAAGHKVAQVACLDTAPTCSDRPYAEASVKPYFPDSNDALGSKAAEVALFKEQPDVVFLMADPGTAYGWVQHLAPFLSAESLLGNIPLYAYVPIEGSPIAGPFAALFRRVAGAAVATQWAQQALAAEYRLDVPYVYHGVDRKVFKPLTPRERERVRADLGWQDKFVVTYVARNGARKSHDRLLRAMAYIQSGGDTYADIHLYLHCKSFDNHNLQGWDLRRMVTDLNLDPARVQFAEDMNTAVRGIPAPDLVGRYGASDLYVSVSQVEGFGLPLVEAMACGLPVVIPADGGNQEEVVGQAAAARIVPHDINVAMTGAVHHLVHPEHVAQVIVNLRDAWRADPARREALVNKGLAQAQQFSWSVMNAHIVGELERLAGDHKERVKAYRERTQAKPVTVLVGEEALVG